MSWIIVGTYRQALVNQIAGDTVMLLATNSAVVWKRVADENRESAKTVGRIAIGLFVLLLAVGAYAFSTRSSLANVCLAVEQSAAHSSAQALNELANSLLSGECA